MRLFLLILLCNFLACSEGDDEFFTACGVVQDREIKNPISDNDGLRVRITNVASDVLVTVRDEDNKLILVALHGISIDSSLPMNPAAVPFLESLGEDAVFFPVDERCLIELDNDIEAVPGQLITPDGRSFVEELLSNGLASVDLDNECDSELLESCYSGLLLES